MSEITTTSNLFTKVDISHKPKRMQGDSFRNTSLHLKTQEESVQKEVVEAPDFITLERAIEYYDSNSDNRTKEGKLNIATAKWLRELLELRATKLTALAESKTRPLTASLNDSNIEENEEEVEEQ